jgi:FkbM family methyltransferase
MIVNRFDFKEISKGVGIGVGCHLLTNSTYEPSESKTIIVLLELCRSLRGDGVMVLDIGANIGVFTVDWASVMSGWGSVLAIEAQEWMYYALAGNITLNNCFNVRALHAAVTESSRGPINIPRPNYLSAGCFGGLQICPKNVTEIGVDDKNSIGQPISYTDNLEPVETLAIDDLNLERVDFIKIDIEGMEVEALKGSKLTIDRCKPLLYIEWIQSSIPELDELLTSHNYIYFKSDINILAIHRDDIVLKHIKKVLNVSGSLKD